MKSLRLLTTSIGLNVALLGTCGWLFTERPSRSSLPQIALSQPSLQATSAPAQTKAAATTATQSHAPSPTLRWADLESDDYPSYIANLRAVGMPEPTLRAVVTAEIVAQDEASIRDLTSSTAAPGTLQGRRQELENLRTQQAARINHLLGLPPIGQTNATAPPADNALLVTQNPSRLPNHQAEPAETIPATTPLALLPAALVPVDPAISLNEQQATEWNKLQQDFVADVGNPNDNAGESTYLDRWITAQRANDAMFKAKYGNAAFILQNLAASRRPAE